MSNLLQVQRVSKKYGSKVVLNHVEFELEKGKIYGLLGPNASGKTTLLKAISGLVSVEGNLKLEGVTNYVELKNTVAFLPVDNFFYPWMSVMQGVQFFADFFEDFNKAQALNLIDAFKLDGKSPIKKLSTGELAKLKIAVTLSRETSLYLLDEPFNGIDLITRGEISQLLLETFNETKTILLTTHLVEEIEEMVDEVIFIKNGEIVLSASADSIRDERRQSIVDLYKEVM